jgi:predicted secreted protein
MQSAAAGEQQAAVRESAPESGRPPWRSRVDDLLDQEQQTIDRARKELQVPLETLLGGIGRRIDHEMKGGA